MIIKAAHSINENFKCILNEKNNTGERYNRKLTESQQNMGQEIFVETKKLTSERYVK